MALETKAAAVATIRGDGAAVAKIAFSKANIKKWRCSIFSFSSFFFLFFHLRLSILQDLKTGAAMVEAMVVEMEAAEV